MNNNSISAINRLKMGIVNTVTPAMAAELLELNTLDKQRSIAQSSVDKYARDMASGAWMVNGETLIISSSGKLLNGQHRLLGCIKAGVPFQTCVSKGVDEAAFHTIDTGKKRSFRDVLSMMDTKYAAVVAPCTTQLYGYDIGASKQKNTPSERELHATFYRHRAVVDSVGVVIKAVTKTKLGKAKTPLAMVHYFGSRVSEEIATEFLEQVTSGANLAKNSPTLLYRELLLNRGSLPAAKIARGFLIATGIKAMNAFLTGTPTLHTLRFRSDEDFPNAYGWLKHGYLRPAPQKAAA